MMQIIKHILYFWGQIGIILEMSEKALWAVSDLLPGYLLPIIYCITATI